MTGDAATEVFKLKQECEGEIVVPASFQLVHTLIQHDLVDELRLMVYPFILGAGRRLFDGAHDKLSLHLVYNHTLGDDLTSVTYEVRRAA